MIRTTTNASHLVQLFGCGVLAQGQRIPTETIADPLPKYMLYIILSNVAIKSLKEADSDTSCSQSTIATRYEYVIMDNIVYGYS